MQRFFPSLLMAMLLAAGLAAPADAGTTSRASTQRTATPTDSQIETTIRTKLAKSKIGKDGFRFHVQRGVVTWEGTTNVMQHKGSATRMARAAGAVQVVNNIHVNGASKDISSLKKASVQQ
ncbi:MAG TPA: BON domain-containing protein [Bryobacteraceae bacterium]|nr:BON domain-containing protein [Bryobacteraceae bacterium]